MNQSYKLFQIIILNNASTDGTTEWITGLAASYNNITVINRLTNVGFVNNIKDIHNLTSSDYIVILSDDDLLKFNFLEKSMEFLLKNREFNIWACNAFIIDNSGNFLYKHPIGISGVYEGNNFIVDYIKGKVFPWWCCTVYKTEKLKKIGGFYGVELSVDLVATLSCSVNNKVFLSNEYLAYYRLSDNNLTSKSNSIDWYRAFDEIVSSLPKFITYEFNFQILSRKIKILIGPHFKWKNKEKVFKLLYIIYRNNKLYTVKEVIKYIPQKYIVKIIGIKRFVMLRIILNKLLFFFSFHSYKNKKRP